MMRRIKQISLLAAFFLTAALGIAGMDTGMGMGSAAAEEAGNTAVATFAGGCFWCMEPPFDQTEGVISTTSGYTGGHKKNPTYEEVSSGGTGHAESVRVVYDPTVVSYEELLEVYWVNIDPLVPNQQFCDGGSQYRSAIFYHDEAQKKAAEASLGALSESGRITGQIFTQINPAGIFYPAEDYHQDYYHHNPLRYKVYRYGCGRDKRLKEIWGDAAGGHHG
ncbi:MAG: peptide-methionine (S)-S-oxide reductase MsrA [Leptospirillia bacterium]